MEPCPEGEGDSSHLQPWLELGNCSQCLAQSRPAPAQPTNNIHQPLAILPDFAIMHEQRRRGLISEQHTRLARPTTATFKPLPQWLLEIREAVRLDQKDNGGETDLRLRSWLRYGLKRRGVVTTDELLTDGRGGDDFEWHCWVEKSGEPLSVANFALQEGRTRPFLWFTRSADVKQQMCWVLASADA